MNSDCAIPENVHTSPMEGIFFCNSPHPSGNCNYASYISLNFLALQNPPLPRWEEYGYFLELPIGLRKFTKSAGEIQLLFIFYHIPSRLLRLTVTVERAWMKLLGDLRRTMGRKKRRGVFPSPSFKLPGRHLVCTIRDLNIESREGEFPLELYKHVFKWNMNY